ncbi:MAG: hypothetical protein Q9166_007632 [cf. Caloplaca sp. 2 TL-2023]
MLSFASLFLLLASLSSSHFPSVHAAKPLCNGHTELCSRKYSNITFIGAHDSTFVGDSPADNQGIPVTAQLDSGIRFLQSQTHINSFKTLSLCHTSCFLNDAGPLTSFLSTIKTWLDKNPNEVLTLLLTNGDRTPVSQFDTAFKSAGLDKYASTPPTIPLAMDNWPTLSTLIAAKTRLIVFLDYGASPTVPYILDEFAYFFETPFNTIDPTFNQCNLDRPPNAKPEGRMYIVNHFLDKKITDTPDLKTAPGKGKGLLDDITHLGGLFDRRGVMDDVVVPDREAAPTTNAMDGKGSIGAQVDLCKGLYKRSPNVVLLDFVDKGEAMKAQRRLNGLEETIESI